MKKNITINLCGRLFNIDEDAYELLHNYIETLRSYFERQEGGNEIADDLEERIAELLEELKSQGHEAINIEHVKQVITRVGQPEEMDGESPSRESLTLDLSQEGMEDGSAEQNSEKENAEPEGGKQAKGQLGDFFDQLKELFRERRFYRNPKDKMLAGVVSGLASTFEVDVTLLRLGVVAAIVLLSMLGSVFGGHQWLMLVNFNVCLGFAFIYLILALIMPEAETPEQQLKMQGKPVNMQNLAEEVVQNVSEKVDKVKQSSGVKSVFNGILKFFVSIFKFLMVLLALALFTGGVFALLWALFAIHSPETVTQYFDWDMTPIREGNMNMFVTFLVALLAALLIPAYAIVQHLVHPLKVWQRLLLLLVWIVALATAITTGAFLDEVSRHYERADALNLNEMVETEDGVRMRLYELDFLNNHGWRILNGEGCNDRFTAKGEYYVDEYSNNRYLDCYDELHRQRYRAERTDTLMPGRYRLTCAARANGRGAFVYTLVNGQKTLQEIPAKGNTKGGIWQAAADSIDRIRVTTQPDEHGQWEAPHDIKEIVAANDGEGYGWSRLVFEPIVITKPNTALSYGLTSDSQFTGQTWLGQWFSACDFVVEKME
jgi:phage shock protein PspC (stress-responsive transcriptional regulator)